MHKFRQVQATAHLATTFMAQTIPGCTPPPTTGTNIRATGAALPTYGPSKSTIGSIMATTVGVAKLPNGITRRRPFTTGSTLTPVPGELVEAMSQPTSVVISAPTRVLLHMVH